MKDLITRIAAAAGPDRSLDVAVHEATGLPFAMEYWSEASTEQTRNLNLVPRYTASLDAAVGLVERVLPGWDWKVAKHGTAKVSDPDGVGVSADYICWTAASAPLALLSAMFKALDAKAACAKETT